MILIEFLFVYSSFWVILLKEVRALAESTPFSDNYSGYQ